MVMRWVDEMPSSSAVRPNQVYDWQAVADDCRSDPGRWGLVSEHISRAHARAIRAGKKAQFYPPEDWWVITKGPRGTHGALYIAFVGAPGARLRAKRAMPPSTTVT